MSGNSINRVNIPLPPIVPLLPNLANPAMQAAQHLLRQAVPYALDTVYHPIQAAFQPAPQGGSNGPSGVNGPYALPEGQSLGQVSSGTQAQPFDVTLSQLATAVYGTRGEPPAGWSAVSNDLIADRLTPEGQAPASEEAVQAWRQEFLGDGTVTSAQQFKAEIYTDGDGNFVLSYRGTAEGMPDWENNFRQGTGFETHDSSDKFTDTAVNTAVEFADVFGNGEADSPADNLAITGHSQGGGLASVGSLASGVPAVTFDASGIHPNTLERMGMSPEAAREIANNGGIRAYSLDSDALSQAQESWVTGLVAPDALGTRIIVEPGPVSKHTVVERASELELDNLSPGQRAAANLLVETLRHSGVPLFDPAADLAYAALSHNPNVLTAAMMEVEPWQAGYQNPSDFGRDLQNAIPDAVKDDFALNTHDLITDVIEVAQTDFANGDYALGGMRILGDLGEGFFNSVGDVVSGFGDQFADGVRDQTTQWADGFRGEGPWGLGDGIAVTIEGIGSAGAWVLENGSGALEWAADGVGSLFETVADLGGHGAQLAVDGFVATVNATVEGVGYVVDAVGTGVDYAIQTASDGWNTVKEIAVDTWDGTVEAVSTGWNNTVDAVSTGWNNTVDAVSSGASWLNDRMPWNW
ncbi:hypothetical protein ACW7G2_07530 [Luteimonas sp. A277]